MQHESDLLDRYFDSLLKDPQAQPPAGLDEATVELVKALVESRRQETGDEQIKNRVWNRVLFATYAPPELIPSYSDRPVPPPPLRPAVAARKPQRLDITFMVAAVFALVCLTGLFIQHTDVMTDTTSQYRIEETRTKYPPARLRVVNGLEADDLLEDAPPPVREVSSVTRPIHYVKQMPE